MFSEQIAKYTIIMEHLLASPAIWLVAGISTLGNIIPSEGAFSFAPWILMALTFYIGTGIYNGFTHGEFRITTTQAIARAKPVIVPVLLFSIKLCLLWIIPLVFAFSVIMTTGAESVGSVIITFAMGVCLVVSLMMGTAIILLKKEYDFWPTLRLLLNKLPKLLPKISLALILLILILAISIAFTASDELNIWQVLITPAIEFTEYALFLYLVGIFRSEPDYLQLPESQND